MFIIFDLDDTLIDTSNIISPFQLQRTFFSLIEEGLKIDNQELALANLLTAQTKIKKSSHVIKDFLDSLSAKKKFYSLAETKMRDLLPDFFEVRCFDRVIDILDKFSRKVPICLVTKGEESYQKQKLKKAGIDSTIFSKIIVSHEKNKKVHYKKLVKYFESSEFIACGDLVDGDLVPAKELNGITIYMGESNKPLDESLLKYLDYKIKHFFEIEPIIEKLIG